MQPQGHLQVLTRLLDDGLDPQSVLDMPRFSIMDGKSGGDIALEDGIPDDVALALNQLGHPVNLVSGAERALFGRGQIIINDAGVLWGGSDPRADGCVMFR